MDDLDTQVLRQAQAWYEAGEAVLLVTVARTWGSSPRPPGSLMALNERGLVVGSVSGGCIEDELVERARAGGVAAVCAEQVPAVVRYGISADQAHRFGLPCGGTIELVLEPVSARSRLDELLQARAARQCTERRLDLRSGAVSLHPGRHDALPRVDEHTLVTQVGPRHRLVVIGAGDLSQFLCQMAVGLNFEVHVCDPRAERSEALSWPGVVFSREMPDDLLVRLPPDARTAVVAVTHDPKLDDLALIEALQSPAFYVGAIGSRQHAQSRRSRLRAHFGLSEAQLAALHGPAGLYIGSRTPAEIALSIMAEVVAAKQGLGAGLTSVADGKALDEAARRSHGEPLADSCPA